MIYTVGYSVSLASLTVAVLILAYFRWAGRGAGPRPEGRGRAGPGRGASLSVTAPLPVRGVHTHRAPPGLPAYPPTVMSRAPQASALHTQLHPHAPVPVLHASRREHLRQGRGALLRRHPRRGRAPHGGRAPRHCPGTPAARRCRRRLRECAPPAAHARGPSPPPASREPHPLCLALPSRPSPLPVSSLHWLQAAHTHHLSSASSPYCQGLCECPPLPAWSSTFLPQPSSPKQQPLHLVPCHCSEALLPLAPSPYTPSAPDLSRGPRPEPTLSS